MGFRQAAVLGPVCFFLGVLFICFNIDHRVLWTPLTEDTVEDGFQFYTTFFNAPPAIKAMLHGMVGVLFLGLMSKLHDWDDSAMFFDGSSIGAVVFGFAVYMTVVIPTLRTIVTPEEKRHAARQDRSDEHTVRGQHHHHGLSGVGSSAAGRTGIRAAVGRQGARKPGGRGEKRGGCGEEDAVKESGFNEFLWGAVPPEIRM
ncbi:ER membrane protein SH3-domain-containing protein [Mycena rebaudengoi]|nr:ER membrane protein SH3-domain-containing protein [Mycena rebaudengoi]